MPDLDLTTLTVNLTPAAAEALDRAADATGDTKTDTVNRALQLYALLLTMAEVPAEVRQLLRRAGDAA